jgi:hypothetical protein
LSFCAYRPSAVSDPFALRGWDRGLIHRDAEVHVKRRANYPEQAISCVVAKSEFARSWRISNARGGDQCDTVGWGLPTVPEQNLSDRYFSSIHSYDAGLNDTDVRPQFALASIFHRSPGQPGENDRKSGGDQSGAEQHNANHIESGLILRRICHAQLRAKLGISTLITVGFVFCGWWLVLVSRRRLVGLLLLGWVS